MDYYLGWNHQEHEFTLVEKLNQIQKSLPQSQSRMDFLLQKKSDLAKKEQLLYSLDGLDLANLDQKTLQEKLQEIQQEILSVTHSSADFESLKEEEFIIKGQISKLQQGLAEILSKNRYELR